MRHAPRCPEHPCTWLYSMATVLTRQTGLPPQTPPINVKCLLPWCRDAVLISTAALFESSTLEWSHSHKEGGDKRLCGEPLADAEEGAEQTDSQAWLWIPFFSCLLQSPDFPYWRPSHSLLFTNRDRAGVCHPAKRSPWKKTRREAQPRGSRGWSSCDAPTTRLLFLQR